MLVNPEMTCKMKVVTIVSSLYYCLVRCFPPQQCKDKPQLCLYKIFKVLICYAHMDDVLLYLKMDR